MLQLLLLVMQILLLLLLLQSLLLLLVLFLILLSLLHGFTNVFCYKLVGAITKPRPMGWRRRGFVMGYTVLLLSLVP